MRKIQNIGMQSQNYEEKVKISGCKLRLMRKKSKYRDANSELRGTNIVMQTQNYEEKVKISGCKLRIMRKKSKYRDENSEL